MISMTLQEAANLLQLPTPTINATFTGICKDTRAITAGNLYVAITGETFDGNDFAEAAHQQGANAVLVSRPVASTIPQLVVEDVIAALGKLTHEWRQRFTLPLIGVTGSNGKTTVKNMIHHILLAACHQDSTRVLATTGNLNNHIGVPFTLAQLDHQKHYGVAEMGMNNAGEIAYLTQLVHPEVAVITNAAESHLQGLKDVAGVARAKGEIFQGLSATGTAILNRDDAFFEYWQSLVTDHRVITFGLNHPADVSATHHTSRQTQSITLHTAKGDLDVELPLLGQHNLMNALAATAATLAIGTPLSAIKTGLEQLQAAPGRFNIHTLANGACVIDDTYNANPFSTHAAIQTLMTFSGKKILILGDMRELGPDEVALHTLTGERAREAGIDSVFTYGKLTEATARAFGENSQHFTDKEALIAALYPFLQPHHTLLVKGSRSMQMDTVVKKLLATSSSCLG